jgi:hypothetical protein
MARISRAFPVAGARLRRGLAAAAPLASLGATADPKLCRAEREGDPEPAAALPRT